MKVTTKNEYKCRLIDIKILKNKNKKNKQKSYLSQPILVLLFPYLIT